MARVIINRADETTRKIADILEQDARDFFYIIDTPCPDTYEIDRGKTSDFGVNKPNYGAYYYATIITNFDSDNRCELAEHFVGFEDPMNGHDTQINIFGYFKSARNAARNLLRYGNTTHDGRKPIEIYK